MKVFVLALVLLLPLALAPTAAAGPYMPPVCRERDVAVAPYVWMHVGLDCEPGFSVTVCPPGVACKPIKVYLA